VDPAIKRAGGAGAPGFAFLIDVQRAELDGDVSRLSARRG
jgi:hypothetical protein